MSDDRIEKQFQVVKFQIIMIHSTSTDSTGQLAGNQASAKNVVSAWVGA
jgi:hypothetical protein